jgi:hypothetical protein
MHGFLKLCVPIFFFLSFSLFFQVCDLNLTGFSKALKKYKKSWGDKKDKKDKEKKEKKEKGNTSVRAIEGGGSRSLS